MPTSRATRVTSEANTLSCSIIVLTIVGRAQELALERAAVDVELHGLQQVALRHGGDRARRLRVVGHSRSSISVLTEPSMSAHAPLARSNLTRCRVLPSLADDLADALELLRHALVGGDDLVEGVGDLALDADDDRRSSAPRSRPRASPAARAADPASDRTCRWRLACGLATRRTAG